MFPHNSSSHEISTETNAFVQNSMRDVVVLGESSLYGEGEEGESEHARYCDIESINSSMMAAPTSHPEATAANDFSTVLPNQAGESSSYGSGKARQSVAPATTKYPTNHLLTYDNNNENNNNSINNDNGNINNVNVDSINNDNNNDLIIDSIEGGNDKEANGIIYNNNANDLNRNLNKITTTTTVNNNENSESKNSMSFKIGKHNKCKRLSEREKSSTLKRSLMTLGSSANNSKSTSKTLSDNKYSFSFTISRVPNLIRRKNADEDEDEDDDNDYDYSNDTELISVRPLNDDDDNGPFIVMRLDYYYNNYTGVPNLVRIPKSDNPRHNRYHPDKVEMLRIKDDHDYGNEDKDDKDDDHDDNNNDNSMSVILLSSTGHGDHYYYYNYSYYYYNYYYYYYYYYYCHYYRYSYYYYYHNGDGDGGLKIMMVNIVVGDKDRENVHDDEENEDYYIDGERMLRASSSITLIELITPKRIYPSRYVPALIINDDQPINPLSVTVTGLTRRICVPLLINVKGSRLIMLRGSLSDDDDDDDDVSDRHNNDNDGLIELIEDIVAVCYKTSTTLTNDSPKDNGNVNVVGSQNDNRGDDADYDDHDDGDDGDDGDDDDDYDEDKDDDDDDDDDNDHNNDCHHYEKIDNDNGINRTEATIYTVGALSFQDNDKSNKPLNDNSPKYYRKYKIDARDNEDDIEANSPRIKDLSLKYKSIAVDHRGDVIDDDNDVRLADNIPMTTCDDYYDYYPTMTLIIDSRSQAPANGSSSKPIDVPARLTLKSTSSVIANDAAKNNGLGVGRRGYKICESTENEYPMVENGGHEIETKYMNYLKIKGDHSQPVTEKLVVVDNCEAQRRRLMFNDDDNTVAGLTCPDISSKQTGSAQQQNNDSNGKQNSKDQKCRAVTVEEDKQIHKEELANRTVNGYPNGNKNLKNAVMIKFENYAKLITDYKRRWGIPLMAGLLGGGESSLNSGGAANWGTTQATTPNNSNANQSGWGGTPGNPSGSGNAQNSWAGSGVNRSVSGNPNQNQNQGPGSQNAQGNVNKVNNSNQQTNQPGVPPTSQSTNPLSQGSQNNSQWTQGKSNNPGGGGGGPGQNPSGQNNNNGPQQQQQASGSGGNNNQVNNPAQGSGVSGSGTPASNNPSTKQQLEQLNTMREALFSQDGWGSQHVNQDTNWDVPASPEPSLTKDGVPMWKPPVNNGTDLWEANLRNGGQPPPQQQAKTPWGHTPATNIGGTWGEDDETADSSNMWTGAPTPSQQNAAQWTAGAAGNQAGSNWGDPRIDHRDPRDLRSVDPREMRDPRDHRMTLDPRDHMRVMDPMARDPRMADMRGDPRGISGRLNGANADPMWGQPPGPPHHQMSHQHPSGPPAKMLNPSNMNQWPTQPPKDMMQGKPSGWEEPSPPTQRRNVPNYDDGTSLWGNPGANQRAMPGSKVSHWKDLPTQNIGRGGMQCPPGMPQNRMPGQPGMKPDVSGPMWGHPGAPGGRNGSWADGPHEASWDDPKTPAAWNEPQLNQAPWGGPTAHKPKPMGGPAGSWADSDMDPPVSWAHPSKPTLTKEVIWNSREFRYLCDLGFKKEDVEAALRNRDMNRDEAQELLSQLRPLDQWRRHDAHSGYDPTNQATTAPTYPRFNHVAQQMTFPPGAGVPSAAATGGVGGSVASASLLKLQQQQQQQAVVPLQQQQPTTNAPQPPFNQASRAPQNQPSTQQLRMLVQQIQLAVQEGYLNHQILNQPLAPQTLILLNQLLQQIKVLQQLHQQHSVQSSLKGNSQSVLQISVQITKTKQQITNLQNQIAVQQATYMKQQQHQQHPAPPPQASEYYKTSVHDPMSALQNSFSDLTMNKEPPVSQQQSRLNQWKLPSLDKDGDLATNEFSRAPGTTSKPPTTPGGLSQSHGSPNMNPLLGQGDGTWSSRLGDTGWPDPSNSDSTDGKDWQPGGSAAFTDLVPEFEPGKPWKGTQMKSIEDDPSITPGSVVRSPLSLATIKDPDAIFSSSTKTTPPPQNANPDTSIPSLSNSPWTFNPPVTTPSAFSSSKNTWGESAPPPTAVTSELWGAPINKARGPPPGLGSKGAANASNGWAGLGSVSRSSSSWALQSSAVSNSGWVSTWLLLKNLTPQIDGSTLKTLCMQHGPVQDFRLYLPHGIALTKYSSRDEAIKAQGALNNCVLGNTTIFAESPADSEVHTLLQQLSHGGQQQAGGSGGAGWGLRQTNKAGPPPDTWGGASSQLWGAPPTSNSLWSNAGIDNSDQQRATPSSLNSFLPGDLLGGESM